MQFQLKRAVAAGSERFHDSLDELENEIRMAQAVLRRDLAQLRAERKQKEAQAKEKEAEKARQTAVVPKLEDAAPPPAPAKSPTPPPVKSEPLPSAATSTAPVKAEPEAPQPPEPKPPTPSADVDMENADALNTTQESEFDFDAMFGDGAMDTSGDGANGTGDLDLDVTDDLDFVLDEAPDQPDLLRGLEDFAKASTDDTAGQVNASSTLDLDFAMADMSDLHTNPPAEQPTATKAEDTTTQQPAAVAAATEELNLDTMVTDNLDELFDLDDYENPEATQFDDAFFGFGDN